jgi:hypothetical protein
MEGENFPFRSVESTSFGGSPKSHAPKAAAEPLPLV